jgi:hypothetical protein
MADSGRGRIILETVGLLAVVVSLIFVGLEIRQNTAATLSATQQAVFEASVQANLNVMNNERLRELLVEVEEHPDWAANAPRDADYLLLKRFYQNRFNDLENANYHYLQGTYAAELWEGQRGWIGLIAQEPLMRHFWSELRPAFMAEFQSLMDSVVAEALGGGSTR